MSFKEKRLEEVRGDSLLVGIGIGVKNQSQIPNIFEDLEKRLGFKLTNEDQKKARDVAVLKRNPKEFKAFFGEVFKRRKTKESEMDKVLRSIEERLNVGIKEMYVPVGAPRRKMELSEQKKEILKRFGRVDIKTEKDKPLELYLVGGDATRLTLFPSRGDRVTYVCKGPGSSLGLLMSLEYDEDGYYTWFADQLRISPFSQVTVELRIYLSPKKL